MTLSRREFLASITGLGMLSATSTKAGSQPVPSGRFAIAGTVLTAAGPPLPNHAVLIRDDTVEAVLPATAVTDQPILAPPCCTIMPGVINSHCHRIHSASERRQRWLTHGVTSIGDVGAPLTAMKALTESPAGATATAAFSGPMLTPPNGYPLPVHSPQHALEVSCPAAGRDAVKRLADQGATLIKISFEPGPIRAHWPQFDPETARAICAQARTLGMVVRCHVEDVSGLKPALDAGVHVIDHVPHRWTARMQMQPVLHTVGGETGPVPYYRALLERMVREDIIMVPTLDVLSRSPWNGPQLYEPVRAFNVMGGRIGLGNDYPYRRTDAGMPLREMHLLAKAGLSAQNILTAATKTSAAACNLANRGTLAPGMKADMLVLSGNPHADISVLSSPLHIIKDGIQIR